MTVFQWHLKKDYIYNIWITYVRNENTKTWYLKFNALWQSSVKRYLLTEDCCKAWNFKYQIWVFSFLTYIIISLFPPIDMVIEHSFMNYSYTAKIYIHLYLYIYIYIYIYTSKVFKQRKQLIWNLSFMLKQQQSSAKWIKR